jgi:hypothetical protein
MLYGSAQREKVLQGTTLHPSHWQQMAPGIRDAVRLQAGVDCSKARTAWGMMAGGGGPARRVPPYNQRHVEEAKLCR